MRHVYFSGIGDKYIGSILNFAKDVYGIKGIKTETIIPTQSKKCPYFYSCCQFYFDDDDLNMHNIIETILNIAYAINVSEISALIYKEVDYYMRTVSIENTICTHVKLTFYSDSFNNLLNINMPSDSFIRWQIYEGKFKVSDNK